jgi:hypothetical protein
VSVVVSARRSFDYQMAVVLVVAVYFGLMLGPRLGEPRSWPPGLVVLLVMCAALYRPVGDRVRFFDDRVEFVTLFGGVKTTWPLDGSSGLNVDPIRTPSRWGRVLTESLVLGGAHGIGLALPDGRYTRQRQWAQFLLGLGPDRLVVSRDARAQLQARAVGAG